MKWAFAASVGVSVGKWVEPELRHSVNGVLETSFAVGVTEYHGEGISFTTRTYEGGLPGPTLVAKPGDTIRLTLKNQLEDDFGVEGRPNLTNFHPHGLHVSPHEDDIFLNVSGGQEQLYTFTLPVDHIQGSFYYHPHRLPGDLIQELGGMGGMIVVQDKDTWSEELAEIEQNHVVIQKVLWCNNASDPCGWNARGHVMRTNHYWFPGLMELEGHSPVPAVTSGDDWQDADYIIVNGVYQPTLPVSAGEYRYLRIVNSAIDMQMKIKLEEPCKMWMLATDGTYLDSPRLLKNNSFAFGIADRCDVLVQCPEEGVFNLVSESHTEEEVDYMGHPGYDEHSFPYSQVLFSLEVALSNRTKGLRFPKELPARPVWMQDLRSVPEEEIHVRRNIWMAGIPSVPGKPSPYASAVVNGVARVSQYVAAPEFELIQDRLEEWTIYNHPPNCTALPDNADQCTIEGGDGTVYDVGSGHQFHMHTNHFQVVRTIPEMESGLDFTVGEFHDTIFFGHNAPSLVIRFRFANFTGPTLYHCHYAKHSFQGMFSKIESVKGAAAGAAPCHENVV